MVGVHLGQLATHACPLFPSPSFVHSLSDSVSYWEQSRGLGSSSQAWCWLVEFPCGMDAGGGAVTTPVGSLIVSGLYGNGVEPADEGLSSQTRLVSGVLLLQSPSE